MAKIRHMYPGGNTCYGFYSFYDHIVPPDAPQKIILKGGPGSGKSTFMKAIASELSQNGIDIEYHWCSSDNNSLDGIVAGDRHLCILDGTAPHSVDPRYPGAVDWIINMGDFWDAGQIVKHQKIIIELSQQISMYFNRAYNRLKETQSAWWEWSSFHMSAINTAAVNRNILALTDDFIQAAPPSDLPSRHLFAAALTPEGIVSKVDTLLDTNWAIFAVKGSPATGVKDLFKHIEKMLQLKNIYGEIYHCPFDPANLDLIVLPDHKTAILDISGHIVDYEKYLTVRQYKRLLDLNQFLDTAAISPYAAQVAASVERFQNGLQQALTFIQTAKTLHDELETYYVSAMDFTKLEDFRLELTGKLLGVKGTGLLTTSNGVLDWKLPRTPPP